MNRLQAPVQTAVNTHLKNKTKTKMGKLRA